MQDNALQQLFNKLHDVAQDLTATERPEHFPALWFADENCHAILPKLVPFRQVLLIVSNRYDIYQQAQQLGLQCLFNDAEIPYKMHPEHIFIRVSKEKAVTHHLINQAALQLAAGGLLHIAGNKNEGIKTYAKNASALFEHKTSLKKLKDSHLGSFSQAIQPAQALPTQNYAQLREIAQFNGQSIVSKPGTFGYEKLDEGSLLLLDILTQHPPKNHDSILDLGCGYGLLTLGAKNLTASYRAATDNNAAALIAIQANAEYWQLKVTIHAGNIGDTTQERFDLILCNPPFHRGFATQGDLTDNFLHAASQKLTPQGCALFVVNSFIGIEKKAELYFKNITTLANTGRFKVLELS